MSIHQIWGHINSEIAILRTELLKGEEIEDVSLITIKNEAQEYGYKILAQKIENIGLGNLEKIQFEYL